MGRRKGNAGVHFVAESIGSLVTLQPTSDTPLLRSGVTLEQKLPSWGEKAPEVQRLERLWTRNDELVAEHHKHVKKLQAFPPLAPSFEVVEETSTSTLKEVLPAPLPEVLEAWDQRPSFLKFGDTVGTGDNTFRETLANVATSAPFLYIGFSAPRKKPYDRLYAASIMGVGVASSMYHSSRGPTRPFFRWCDYAAIGASSLCLTKALNPSISNRWLLLSASFLPVQPMLVTAVHTAFMEYKFAKRSIAQPERYQKAHRIHAASTLVGGVCFLAEEVYPDKPFIHAAWHMAAALSVYTCNALLG